jgi:hypothetical protein
MTTTVAPPAAALTLSGLAPSLLQSCILAPTPAVPPTIGDNDIYTPVAPGVTYAALPTVTIIDTSPTQVIGCANDVGTTPQQTLNALFPAAITGDGVVDRATNDFWVYDGTTWNNVGPNPGPTIVDATIIPPWNEILSYDATVRTRLQIQSLDYALALLTEPDPIGVVLGLDARRVRRVLPPAVAFDVTAPPCIVSISAKAGVPAASVALASFAPSIATGAVVTPPPVATTVFAPMPKSIGRVRAQVNPEPTSVIELTAQAPQIRNAVALTLPSAALTLVGNPPTGVGDVLVLPAIGDALQGGFYAGLISHTADGNPTHALIVAPIATGATGGGYPVTTALRWKTSDTDTPGSTSVFDGVANTNAIIAAGITDHPAAEFCVNLSIGGYTDWYLPAPLELDIAYHNLKPTTFSNSTAWGINDYSVPKRTTNRTAGDPPQTSVTAFKLGGSEAFRDEFHWSSRQQTTSSGVLVTFFTGSQTNFSKGSTARLRAFRRIAL